jgi:hypothetical protein
MTYGRGKIATSLRVPPVLHAELAEYSEQAGLSMNDLITSLLAFGIRGAKRSGKYKPSNQSVERQK